MLKKGIAKGFPYPLVKWGINLVYEEQPTKDVVISGLQKVLNNEISREEFNLWAYKWVENFDNRNRLSSEEDERLQP